MSSNARPKARRLGPDNIFRDTTRLHSSLQRDDMDDLRLPGAVLLQGWLAA